MLKLVKKINGHILLNSIMTIALGVAMLLVPLKVYHASVNVISIYMVVIGVINIVDALLAKRANRKGTPFLIYGILYIVVAGIIYLFADQIVKSVPFVLGIIILLSGFSHLIQAVNMASVPGFNKVPMIVYSVILIMISLFFIFRTASSLILLFQVYGAVLIVMGIIDIILVFYLKKQTN